MASQTINKLDAACQQLNTAISLWFSDGDAISVHTLACSAYQIVHDINRRQGGRDLHMKRLTEREWRWLWEYTRTGGNASQAARIAYGGTPISVRVKGHKKKVKLKPFLDKIDKIWDPILSEEA